jgi:GWxTD domain-containing protein
MRITTLFTVVALFFVNCLQAKDLGASISYAVFMDDKGGPYLELYFAIAGNSLNFEKVSATEYQGKLDALVTIGKLGKNVNATKFRIKTDRLSDTLQVPQVLLHQERISVPQGELLLFIELTDPADTSKAYPIEQRFTAKFKSTVCASDLVLLESYKKADAPGTFTKSGFNLYPIISNGLAYVPPGMNEISFYAELYNTGNSFGENGQYAYRYYLKDIKTQKKLSRYGRTLRGKVTPVKPILGNLNITKLPTGRYELILEVINSKGEVTYEKNSVFFRQAAAKPLVEILAEASDNPQNFARTKIHADSLYGYIRFLSPISSDKERLMQNEVLERAETAEMQNYLFGFWEEKFPGQAEAIWNRYLPLVRYANKEFTSTMQRGYLTDRGVVYLSYGAPAQIEDRPMEPSLPPYQIWQYQTVSSPWKTKQANKIFVFAEFQHPTNDYELIHSNAIGELTNERWRYQLANGKLGTDDLDDTNPNMGDEMGSRLNNNTLIMGGGN